MKSFALVALACVAGCHESAPPAPSNAVSPVLTAPAGVEIVPVAIDKSDPKAPRALPADSPLTNLSAEEVADKLPAFAGARVLDAPSNLGGAAFVVQTSACLLAGTRVDAALARAGWRVIASETAGERTSIEAVAAPYLLSATAQVGVDPRCDRAAGEELVELVLRKRR